MNVNNRAIAIALATVGVVGLSAVPTLGQRSVTGGKSDAKAGIPGNVQRKKTLNPSTGLQIPERYITQYVDGGIAGATTTYSTCFEAPFTPGAVAGQQGWTVLPAGSPGFTISNTGAPQGTQSLQIAGGATPGNESLAVNPSIGVVGPGRYTVTFTANISALGGADYIVNAISNTDGLIVAKLHFHFADLTTGPGQTGDADSDPGDILVLDDIGSGLQFVATGSEWVPGANTVYRMEIDSDANRIKYFMGSTLIYIGDAFTPNSGVEATQFRHDNFQNAGETGKFDCYTVESANGLCSADTSKDNQVSINDLLDVINTWGPCAVIPGPDCPADIDGSGATDINDLLEVINNWGPCAVPTGACCASNGSCTAGLYAACITGGGEYSGNGTDCTPNDCPQPANNDFIAGAVDITANINGAAINANNGVATPPQHDGVPGSADPEIPAGSPACQWNFVPSDTHNTLWFKFTAPPSGNVTVGTCTSVLPFQDSILEIYSGTPGSLVSVVCAEDSLCDPSTWMSRGIATGLTPGNVYYVMVGNPGSWGGSDPGAFVLTITSP